MDLTRKGEIDKQKGKRDGKIESSNLVRNALEDRPSLNEPHADTDTEQEQLLNIDIRIVAAVHAYIIIIIIIIRHSMSSDYVGLYTHGQSCLNEVRRINLVLVYCVCDC